MPRVVHKPGPGRERLAAALRALDGSKGQVGWFESSKYPNGQPAAYIATIHEYGYSPHNIPPRMGLRSEMIPARQPFWAKVAEQFAKQILDGRSTAADAMEALGGVAQADIIKQIKSVDSPPLKESTLETRASRLGIKVDALTGTGKKPLIEPKQADGSPGGYLVATVQHIVTSVVQE